MSPATVAIELLFDRIDVAAIRGGRAHATRRIPVKLPTNGQEWLRAIRDSGPALRDAVAELQVSGRPAIVLYRSPTQSVDLARFEIRSATEACSAARLKSIDSLPYSISSAVCRTVVAAKDRGGLPRRTHVIVGIERAEVVRAIVEIVEAAGLVFRGVTPLDAATLTASLRRAVRHTGPRRGWLYCGEYSSFFFLAGGGTIAFDRSIAIGTRTIVQALTRPIRLPGGDDLIELKPAAAERILHQHGIPDSDEVVLDESQLTRRHIMPLIQPVLQRYVVELRQSLRFGITDEKERASIEIDFFGPGSTIPGFAALLGWELRLDIKTDEPSRQYDYTRPASPGGELVGALSDPGFLDQMNLDPPEMAQRRETVRLRQWLWAGAAAAMVAVGVDAILAQSRLGRAQREAEVLTTSTASLEQLQRTQTVLLESITALNGLGQTIGEQMGDPVDVPAVLQELSRLTPGSVRLTRVGFRREGAQTRGRLNGEAARVRAGAAATELETYIDALKRSPLLETVVPRTVEVLTGGAGAGQRFEIIFDLVAAPTPPPRPALSAVAHPEGTGP